MYERGKSGCHTNDINDLHIQYVRSLKGLDRQFPCAEGHNSLTPDLVEIPLMGVQICTQQTHSPVKNYPLISRRARVFGQIKALHKVQWS